MTCREFREITRQRHLITHTTDLHIVVCIVLAADLALGGPVDETEGRRDGGVHTGHICLSTAYAPSCDTSLQSAVNK